MRKVTNLSDYEKAVATIAGQIYANESVRKVQDLKEGQSFSIDELISECVMDAFQLVDGVIECTRDEND